MKQEEMEQEQQEIGVYEQAMANIRAGVGGEAMLGLGQNDGNAKWADFFL
jgi:hypothetical protein